MKRHNRPVAFILLAALLLSCACASLDAQQQQSAEHETPNVYTGQMELEYAQMFRVDYRADGCALITIGENDRFLLVPEGQKTPEDAEEGAVILQQPLDSIYVASSSVMDLFMRSDALDAVSMTSTSAENWTIPQVRELVREDEITFVGKYSTPDYETVTDIGCDLAVENTMIYHSPDTKEQLERLGIPVLVELSSYEEHPLGRVEWIKLYGLLTGHTEDAERFFAESVRQVGEVEAGEAAGKTVVFFYITASGTVSTRRPDDYIAKMIELSGGTYLFPAEETPRENALSSAEIQMEEFYAHAREADILIYNSTVQGELGDMEDLLALNPLFADFRAVQNGDVWCTGQNMFQQVGGTANMISDLHTVICGKSDPLIYLRRLS